MSGAGRDIVAKVERDLGKETSLLRSYAGVAAVLGPFLVLLTILLRGQVTPVYEPVVLLRPVFALVALTLAILGAAAVLRNVAIVRGAASMRYYERYEDENAPVEWIERPARTYGNLLQVPMLFYAVCALMLATGQVDTVQVHLAWLFVATRVLHAFIYIGFNRVPLRFAAFFAGVITLGTLWVRFASAVGMAS